jgi:2-polyprenyl-6-methoxyphenol hydroxylase-like FAD-dependent oxidoreductase
MLPTIDWSWWAIPHAMSPAYGQAANALEDAATLAVCIRDHDGLDKAMEHFSQLRIQRCLEMQRKSATIREIHEDGRGRLKWIFLNGISNQINRTTSKHTHCARQKMLSKQF